MSSCALVPLVAGENYKLSGPMPLGPAGDVGSFLISPDDNWVVYRADQGRDEVFELYTVPLDGSERPRKLNGAVVAGGDVGSEFLISSDSSRVVYRADHDVDDRFELYSVPVGGGAGPTRLNGPLVPGGDVSTMVVSPDTSRVVYLADQDTDDVYELFSVPLDGNVGPTKLNGSLVAGGDVGAGFLISSDGSRVVYLADQDTDEMYELYSVPLDGSAGPVKLNGPLVAVGDVRAGFLISSDSSRVVYRDHQGGSGLYELFSVPLDGSAAPTQLNLPLPFFGVIHSFLISPDGNRVVYRALQDGIGFELFGVPIDGSQSAIKLNGPLAFGGSVATYTISPDSSRIVYRADQDTYQAIELYSVPLDGSQQATRLNGPLVPGGDVPPGFLISPDSSRVVYLADQIIDEKIELFSVPLDGRQDPTKLNGGISSAGDVSDGFLVSPDSRRVVYYAIGRLFSVPLDGSENPAMLSGLLYGSGAGTPALQSASDSTRLVYVASQDTIGVFELNVVVIDGSQSPITLNDPLYPMGSSLVGDVLQARVSPDSSRVVYLADQDTDDVREIYSAPLDGSQGSIRLNGPLVDGGNLWIPFLISPDSSRVVYLADQVKDDMYELYSVTLDGSWRPTRLNGPIFSFGDVSNDFQISPDSSRVVYRAPQDSQTVELYSVPLGGGQAPTKLNSPLVASGKVKDLLVSPDSSRVVYRATQESQWVDELYSVPIDGSQDPVNLNGPLVADGNVTNSVLISPDSSRVVYIADQDRNGIFDIYSVPLDGSQGPTKLNRPFVAGGAIRGDFLISPDSSWVVYRTELDTPGAEELYSVPIDGSQGPIKLSSPLVEGGDVLSMMISPDGRRVVYRVYEGLNWEIDLYSVPIDGSQAPSRLNSPLVAGGGVSSFLISSGGGRVVYRADQDTDEMYELYSVPLSGSQGPTKLSGALVAGGDVGSYVLNRLHGGRVVYVADGEQDDVWELYWVPLDGSQRPVQLNGRLVAGGGVASGFEISPDGERAVYRADQDEDEAVELYASSPGW